MVPWQSALVKLAHIAIAAAVRFDMLNMLENLAPIFSQKFSRVPHSWQIVTVDVNFSSNSGGQVSAFKGGHNEN